MSDNMDFSDGPGLFPEQQAHYQAPLPQQQVPPQWTPTQAEILLTEMNNRVQTLEQELAARHAAAATTHEHTSYPEEVRGQTVNSQWNKWKPPKPQVYNGDRRPEAIATWIHKITEYFALAGVPEDKQARMAGLFLTGSALTWWQSFLKEYNDAVELISWEIMKDSLVAFFQIPNKERSYWDHWYSLKQTNTVLNYATEFKRTRLHLAVEENLALDHFVRHLKEPLRKEVLIREPNTVEDAIRIADTYETIMDPLAKWKSKGNYAFRNNYNGSNNGFRRNKIEYEDNRGTPMELDTINTNGKSTPLTSSSRFTGKCFYCQKTGHRKSECLKLKANRTRTDGKNHPSQ